MQLIVSVAVLVMGVMLFVAVMNSSHRLKLLLDQSKLQTKLLQQLMHKEIGGGE